MNISRQSVFNRIENVNPDNLNRELNNIINTWNSHNSGASTWDNASITTLTTPAINSTFIGIGRNRIINGGMRIDQRNEGAAVTINSATAVYTLDRWAAVGQATDGVFTVVRSTSTPPTGFTHFLRATVTTADSSIAATQFYSIYQRIEGNNIYDFQIGLSSAKTITLSYWVRSSLTGTFSGALQNSAQDRSYPFSYTINSANTWEQKTLTIVLDTTGTWLTTNGIGLGLYFDLGSGSTVRGTSGSWAGAKYYGATGASSVIATNAATWDLGGTQLEIGSTATSFEVLPTQLDLMLCQRYYEKSYSQGTALGSSTSAGSSSFWAVDSGHSGAGGSERPFAVDKRASPTMTPYSTTGASGNIRENGASDAASTMTNQSTRSTGLGVRNTGAWTAGQQSAFQWTADAEL